MDANADGIGDFNGLLRRLDYLHGLGVTAIWLMPFQPSPPRYGTLGDFVEFTHGCQQRGIRVVVDLVGNHTSDAHPWFRDARSSPDSRHRDWYVWADKRPANASSNWTQRIRSKKFAPIFTERYGAMSLAYSEARTRQKES
jgi:maltose alpha-D-glucosyltransferase/alpha-amylase